MRRANIRDRDDASSRAPFLLAAVGLVAFAGSIGHAEACSCVRPAGSLVEHRASLIADSEVAFSGRVVSVREIRNGVYGRPSLVAEIAVSKVHKGRASRMAFVVTNAGDQGASCGFSEPLKAALRSRRQLTLVSFDTTRIAGVKAHTVNICGSGPFLIRD